MDVNFSPSVNCTLGLDPWEWAIIEHIFPDLMEERCTWDSGTGIRVISRGMSTRLLSVRMEPQRR